jgi:hypothetical protein
MAQRRAQVLGGKGTEISYRNFARQHPPGKCYRLKGDKGAKGRYAIKTVSISPKTGEVSSLTLLHGADSFAPGFAVGGAMVSDLVPCGCGLWREATDEEWEDAATAISEYVRRGKGARRRTKTTRRPRKNPR